MKLFGLRDNSTFWRYLTNTWTLILFVATIYDFVSENSLAEQEILVPISAIYVVDLSIYSADKEFKRWKDCHDTAHPGEVYLILWTILVMVILVIAHFKHVHYHMPAEVISSYIGEPGVLADTKESKKLYREDKKGRKNIC